MNYFKKLFSGKPGIGGVKRQVERRIAIWEYERGYQDFRKGYYDHKHGLRLRLPDNENYKAGYNKSIRENG